MPDTRPMLRKNRRKCPLFREQVTRVRGMGMNVIDRRNLKILEEAAFAGLDELLAAQQMEIAASLFAYL